MQVLLKGMSTPWNPAIELGRKSLEAPPRGFLTACLFKVGGSQTFHSILCEASGLQDVKVPCLEARRCCFPFAILKKPSR